MTDKRVDLINNIDDQREYLERNLEQLNTVVGAILGIYTELRINQKNNYLEVIDDRNLKEACGVMQHAFKKVTIGTFGIWWNENGVVIEFDFFYKHIDGGTNGGKFCTIAIENDFVRIID